MKKIMNMPKVIPTDEISSMSDEILMNTISQLLKEKNSFVKQKNVLKAYEIELCYLRREAQIRRKRKNISKKLEENINE